MNIVASIDSSPLDEFLARFEDSTNLLSESGFADGVLDASDVYFESMRERFDLSSLRGGDWAEHAPSTIKKRGPDAPILFDKGDLRRAMDRSDQEHIVEVEESRVREANANEVARFHQDGTEKMPARPILVQPDNQTLDAMKDPITYGLQVAAKDAASGR